ncbi:YwiC-like family protein [Salisediminibacterium beveridgei]|uniref:YwiC-like protein n=1 Tax=Salisediminibacterium beveridgei TaxID=632773 RepID=A0A1D7QT16_9BACI|nr:YwiC-like family protein [Salisediminibacterium beveridgei]AOM82172.1 hypothetical protein BBEV_0801 [Salisediminibacterium beveridgei]
MKWYIPREHGAWAMLIVPFWSAAFAAGLSIHHLLFFTGIFAVYFAQAPLLTWVKNPSINDVWPSFILYLSTGLLFTVPYLVMDPALFVTGLLILPFFLMNILFAKLKKERWFINDLCAIAGLSGLGFLAWQLASLQVTHNAFLIVLFNFLFFTGSVFHVKSLIREKRNKRFIVTGKVYHALLIGFFSVYASWPLIAAGLLTFLKTMLLNEKILSRPGKIGVVEIVNSVVFFIAMALHF